MIFFAVASPRPGSASNSLCEAVFTSTFSDDCSCFCEDFFLSLAAANAVPGARPSTSNSVNNTSAIRFRERINPSLGKLYQERDGCATLAVAPKGGGTPESAAPTHAKLGWALRLG